MSGLGNHGFSTNNKSIWKPDLAICPYCENPTCEADFADVGVGLVQCGPYHCTVCGAIEIGAYDNAVELSDIERDTGWYRPHRPYTGCGNTINGELVGHRAAEAAYKLGILDVKGRTEE